jgi:hypothetical protein
MNNFKADWHILKGALGLFAIAALVAAGILTASNLFWLKMQAQYQQHYSHFRQISARYLAVDEEERIIVEQYPTFLSLYEQGVLGPERRLSWIEALKSAGSDLGVPQVEFNIDPQQPFVPTFALNTGTFELGSSVMRLSLGLLHEGDLVGLFEALDEKAQGLYSVDACTLSRINSNTTLAHALQPNIEAVCTLRWFTLDVAGADELKL